MQIILRKEIERLGKTGEVVKVKPGYARNFLIPQGYAFAVTKSNLAKYEHEKKMLEIRELKEKRRAGDLAAKLEGLKLIAPVQVGEDDRMFGSVTSQDIAELIREREIEVDRRKIQLEEPIKHLGEFEVPVKLHKDVTVLIKLDVVKSS